MTTIMRYKQGDRVLRRAIRNFDVGEVLRVWDKNGHQYCRVHWSGSRVASTILARGIAPDTPEERARHREAYRRTLRRDYEVVVTPHLKIYQLYLVILNEGGEHGIKPTHPGPGRDQTMYVEHGDLLRAIETLADWDAFLADAGVAVH